jgi:transcriptional regulator with PAS, ATPase and Fis domain
MSTASNSVTPVTVTTAMDPNLYGADEPIARKTERAETSFVETIVGRCGGLRSVLSEVEVVAPTDATVLITGETGTGKGVIARAVHELSPRRTRNLVKLNCTAMPAGLLESELFGHVRGAFYGRHRIAHWSAHIGGWGHVIPGWNRRHASGTSAQTPPPSPGTRV